MIRTAIIRCHHVAHSITRRLSRYVCVCVWVRALACVALVGSKKSRETTKLCGESPTLDEARAEAHVAALSTAARRLAHQAQGTPKPRQQKRKKRAAPQMSKSPTAAAAKRPQGGSHFENHHRSQCSSSKLEPRQLTRRLFSPATAASSRINFHPDFIDSWLRFFDCFLFFVLGPVLTFVVGGKLELLKHDASINEISWQP